LPRGLDGGPARNFVASIVDGSASDRTVLLLAFVWLALLAGLRPLALPDEGRYVSVAWEMIRSGDWLMPTLDGLPYFHKPPLFYWITAASLMLGHSTHMAARVAPMIGAYMTCGSLFLFARRWAAAQLARASLLVLVTSPLVYFGAQFANLDMLVAGCIAAAVLAFAHAALLDPDDPGRTTALLAAYAICALGVLAKGLIGIVLPGLVLFLWLSWEGRWKAMLGLLRIPGIALFLLIAGPWFVLMQARFEGFAHYFFVVQHFQRYAQPTFNNPQPFWFYPVVLAVLGLPWTLWLPAIRALRWQGNSHDVMIRRLMLVWAIAITLFFSIPHSKLVGYILPVSAPLVYLATDAGLASRRKDLWKASAIAAMLLCLVALAVVGVTADRSQADLGRILREHVQPGDEVIALDAYPFAVPFEARLQRPMVVVSDWSPEAIGHRDNWRKELADAAVFKPGQHSLIFDSQLPARVCATSTAWLIGDSGVGAKYAWLAQAERVAVTRRHLVLWRVGAASAARSVLCGRSPDPTHVR
jgi:4-amino-4-deoxy-L-arabinose transferase-like glycosyltransferase